MVKVWCSEGVRERGVEVGVGEEKREWFGPTYIP